MDDKILKGFLVAVIALGSGYLVYSLVFSVPEMLYTDEKIVSDKPKTNESEEVNKVIVYDALREVYIFDAESKTSRILTILNNEDAVNRAGLHDDETSIDPTGRYVLFTYDQYAEQPRNLNILSIYDTKTQTRSDEVYARADANYIRNINWSPDGSKYSYIIYRNNKSENKNDIADSFIRSIDGEILASITDGVSQPIVWKNNSKISFIQDGTLYLGTIENPKQQVVVTDALKEYKYNDYGKGRMRIPHWQGDYLVYESTQGFLYAYDSVNGIKTEMGSLDPCDSSSDCVSQTNNDNAFPLGWLDENTFLFSTQPDEYGGGMVLKKFDTLDKSVAVVWRGNETTFSHLHLGHLNVISNMNQVVSLLHDSSSNSIGLRTLSLNENSGELTQQCEYISESTRGDWFNYYRSKFISTVDSGYALIEINRYRIDSVYEIIGGAVPNTVFEMINTTDCSLVTSIEV